VDQDLGYLYAPPKISAALPVRTHAQTLPFSDLSWENFERLCVRLAETESQVEHVQRYGTAGQAQAGIDIYVRRSSDDYWVYQCRRVQNFTPTGLKKVASDFLEGEWASRASRLILCTSADLTSTKLAETAEGQHTRLQKDGKTFLTLDVHGLSRMLKDQPKLVLDFFDRAWLLAFCPDVCDALATRLGAVEVDNLRRQLRDLYANVFARQDAAVLLGLTSESDRPFVAQDITERRELTFGTGRALDRSGEPESATNSDRGEERDVEKRMPLEAWLTGARAHVLSADAGSGKSSLLRYLAVDLLSDAPKLTSTITRWRDHVPVWLPFGFWVKRIERDESCSLAKAMRDWLASYSEERCWPLVERALQDERLLLMVDGLDEWVDVNAATTAFRRLAVFVEQRGTPLLATTRPAALAQIGPLPAGWREGSLAGLTPDQQHELVIALDSECVDEFLQAVTRSSSLIRLARTPLLLVLLLSLYRSDEALPRDRFNAYRRSLEYLVREHPKRREGAPAGGPLDDQEMIGALGALAYHMQRSGAAVIEIGNAEAAVVAHLEHPRGGPGLERPEARRLGREAVADAHGRLGVVVPTGAESVAFLHRSFQEHLAAVHLTNLPANDLLPLIVERAPEPTWREVVLNALSLIGIGDAGDALLGAITDDRSIFQLAAMQPLLAEIYASGLTRPARLDELGRQVRDTIETTPRSAMREQTLTRLLETGKLDARDEAAIETWLPSLIDDRARVLNEMAKWPVDEQVLRTVWRALFDEDTETCRAAARCYLEVHEDRERAHGELLELLQRPIDPQTRAAALEVVASSDPENSGLGRLMAHARSSTDGNLRAVAHKWRIDCGEHNRDDLEDLLSLAGRLTNIDYGRKPDLFGLIMRGWPGDPKVKEISLSSVRDRQGPVPIEQDGALWLLLQGFPDDADVINYCVEQIDHADYPFLMSHFDSWRLLAENFRDEPRLVEAIDRWIPKQEYREVEISCAARVGRTDTAKSYMVAKIIDSSFPHWYAGALLDEWGMEDADVASALVAAACGESGLAGRIAYEIPRILEHRNDAITRLKELLSDAVNPRPELALMALGELDAIDDLTVEAALTRGEQDGTHGEVWYWLIRYAPEHPRVREIVGRYVENDWYPASVVARSYGDDPRVRVEICRHMNPLPAQLRTRAAEAIRDGCGSRQLARRVTDRFLSELDPLAAATLAQARVRRGGGSELPELEVAVAEGMIALGPSLERTRQAALTAAIELGQVELFAEAREPLRPDEPASVVLTDFRRPNIVLAETVAHQWEQLRADVDDLIGRLSERSAPAVTWDALALVADSYPRVAEEALCELDAGRACSASLLRLHARLRPTDERLLDKCLRALSGDLRAMSFSDPLPVASAELIADAFGGDAAVLEQVCRAGLPIDTELLVLAEGWPDSDQLKDRLAQARREKLVGLPDHIARVRIAVDSPKEALAVLREHIGWLSVSGGYADRALPAIVRRLRRDAGFAHELEQAVFGAGFPNEIASFTRLLALAGVLTPDAHERLLELSELAFTSDASLEVAYDVVADQHRPLAFSLLDALGAT
jgi:hypothetical protein